MNYEGRFWFQWKINGKIYKKQNINIIPSLQQPATTQHIVVFSKVKKVVVRLNKIVYKMTDTWLKQFVFYPNVNNVCMEVPSAVAVTQTDG